MIDFTLRRMRLIGALEGVSFLVLLGIAMPLKYLADMPLAVRIVGSVHGALFFLLCLALANLVWERLWSVKQAAVVFVAALLPFGPFLVGGRLRQAERRGEGQ